MPNWRKKRRFSIRQEGGPVFSRLDRAAYLLILTGTLPRLIHFLSGRALWLDEVQAAHAILVKPAAQFLEPLDLLQIAPPLYVLSQKVFMAVAGVNVYSVRLLSLMAGAGTLLILWPVLKRICTPGGALRALAFAAFSQHLIYYSGECKPYALDAFLAVALLWLTLLPGRRGAILFGLTAAAGVWASIPLVFVVTGLGGARLIRALYERRGREAGFWFAACAFAAGSFLIYCLLFVFPLKNYHNAIGYMSDYWKHGYMPFPPRSLFELRWFRERVFLFLEMPGGFTLTGLALFTVLTGAVDLLRRQFWIVIALIAVLAAALLASGLRAYPFHGRATLYLAPFLFLLAGQGVAFIAGAADSDSRQVARGEGGRMICRAAGAILLVLLIAQPLARAVRVALEPPRHHELGAVLEAVERDWREDDLLYLGFTENLCWPFIRGRYTLPAGAVIGEKQRRTREEPLDRFLTRHLPAPGNKGRVWYVWTFDHENALHRHLDYLEKRYEAAGVFRARGAAAWCFRRRIAQPRE
jgi:hypothetical protein